MKHNQKNSKKLRTISPAFIPALPSKTATRTRLNPTADEIEILHLIGAELSSQESWATAQRTAAGSNWNKNDSAKLKRDLTARGLTSRQAGSISRRAQAEWRAARQAQRRYLKSLLVRIAVIEKKLKNPPGTPNSYRSPAEHFQKTRRLNVLKNKLNKVGYDQQQASLHIVRGGKQLLKTRHSLVAAGLTELSWLREWQAKRHSLEFAGEPGKLGNQTLRFDPLTGIVELRVPPSLQKTIQAAYPELLTRGRLQFLKPVIFKRLGTELAAEITAQRSISYKISYHPQRRAWYLDATFAAQPAELLPQSNRLASVDLNQSHLSAWISDRHGNPVGKPLDIPLSLAKKSASTRDATLRHAITKLIKYSLANGATSLAIENLGWEPEKTLSKETISKKFRSTIHGIPTTKFRDRIIAMCSRAGLTVLAIDPAYTSQWGKQHWMKPLNVSVHQAASLMILRRALDFSGRRRLQLNQQQSMPADLCHVNSTAESKAKLSSQKEEDFKQKVMFLKDLNGLILKDDQQTGESLRHVSKRESDLTVQFSGCDYSVDVTERHII